MKLQLLLFALFLTTGLATSCSDDDDPPPPHIVGNWSLKNYATINVPEGFKRNEGLSYELNEINLGIKSYSLELQQNGAFEREITSSGTLPQEDHGTYTWEEDVLILDSEKGDTDETYGMEKNKDDRLWISLPVQFWLIEDAIYDTLTEEYANSISDEEFEALHTAVDLDFVFAFEREK